MIFLNGVLMDEFLKGLFFVFRFFVYFWIDVWLYLKLDKIWYQYTKLCILFLVVLLILIIHLIANF